jgi:hypothetical protein
MNDDMDSVESNLDELYKNVINHKVVGTRHYSDGSIKKNINNTNFEQINKIQSNTTFYNIESLSKINFNQIYNLLFLSTYVIFVDNYKLKKSTHNCIKRNYLVDTEFPGCTFLPFEAVNIIKKNLNKLNNNVFESELEGTSLYINENVCYGIMFHEGEIIKNCLYKKMEITDTIMFLPISNYNLKQTEYKLRGFCQIVEELGAKNIEIIFKNSDSTETKKNIDAKIGDDIEIIAGNLGLNNINKQEQSCNYSYNLSYPGNSTINLNERMIKNNIKKNKFIVSDSIFKSTLELQYLVHSRCRHLIDKYSTIFTFDNTNIIDKTIYLKLKSHGIELGGSYKYQHNNKNNIIIITKVTFYSLSECKNIISGNNVSLDEVGFNHIMESIQSDDLKEQGIYKIMNFINCYIYDIIKNTKYYNLIHNISTRIKKELTIKEYGELLCNYFNKESQWIHFNNFIDILCKKTPSYDKLGYIILMYDINKDDFLINIIKFIQQLCINKNIEDKFWKMLQPYNKSLEIDLNNKLLIEYDLNNWYNMNMLIQSINSYTINFDTNLDDKLKQMINNMEVGYKYWEYYTNVLPFILKYANYIPNEIYISTMFEKSINIDSFLVCKINNLCDLKEFIEKKFQRIKDVLDIKNSLTLPIEINDFCGIFEKNNYILKKIQYIMKVKSIANIKRLLNLTDCVVNENSINLFLNKIFTYNEKLDIKKIPKNYIGYQMVLDNYNSGLPEEEFEKTVLPFLNTTKNKLTINEFNIYSSSYFEILQYINNKL